MQRNLQTLHKYLIQCRVEFLIVSSLKGHAGIGKTTLVKEICTEWAENKLLTSDKLVLLLLLRDPNVQKIINEQKLIEHFTKSTSKVEQLCSYLEDKHGGGVTLIIDGFDELSTELRRDSYFRELIEKRSLAKAKIVVTSRPSASACLHHVIDRRIEILGFEQSSKNQYITEALQDSPLKLEKLQRHLQQYPNIDAICYIPLIMSIIVFLCMCQPDELPSTATKMYASFILHTICHYLKRVGKIPEDKIINKLEQFPLLVYIAIQQLEKVAFDGLINDKIVFIVEELPVLCKYDPTCYGLLQSTECYSVEEIGTPTQSFNFLHLGIQEYFAAKYVTRLPKDELYKHLKESFIVPESKSDSNPDSKSVRLSNMWILYCGMTSGQCKTLRHYLTSYNTVYDDNQMLSSTSNDHTIVHSNTVHLRTGPTASNAPAISQWFDPLHPSTIPSCHSVTTQTVYSRYSSTHLRDHRSYLQPFHPPSAYQQQQHLVQYPPLSTNPLLFRSHDTLLYPITMHRPTVSHLHYPRNQAFTSPASAKYSYGKCDPNPSMIPSRGLHDHVLASPATKGYFTSSTSKQNNCILNPQASSGNKTESLQQGLSSDEKASNTVIISRDVLKDPVKVLYLFQCFQEAQDNTLCQVLSKSFNSGTLDITDHSLLLHQVVSLGFFLSRSHRKWNTLSLHKCYIGDHGITTLHQYLCGDKINKQKITEINFGRNHLTAASSHLIGDIIGHLQPHTLWLDHNKITNVRDISTAVIATSTVKVLDMRDNDITAQEAIAISDVMICLEELYIGSNKLGDHGAELLSEGIRNTKTLRVLKVNNNIIGPLGTTAIANALADNTSLVEVYMNGNKVGQEGATAIAKAITNNKTLKKFLLVDHTMDKESAMIIMKSLHYNNTITKLWLPKDLQDGNIKGEVVKVNNSRSECNVELLILN